METQQRPAGQQEEHVKAQLTQELAHVVAQVGVQAVEEGRDDLLLLRGCGWLELGQVPVHTGPAHQAEHHTDGGQGGPLHGEEHGPWIEAPRRAICADACWKPDERQERIQRPRRTTGSAGGEQPGKDGVRWTVQYGGGNEAGSEGRGERHERKSAENEGPPADSYGRNGVHKALSSWAANKEGTD